MVVLRYFLLTLVLCTCVTEALDNQPENRDDTTADPCLKKVMDVRTPENSTASRPELLKSVIQCYDKQIPPYFVTEKQGPTLVLIQLNVYSINDFRESTMDYSMTLFLQQKWLDPRLAWNHVKHSEPLELDSSIMDKLWVPDLFFSNEKEATWHKITVPNRMMHLFKNGTVLFSMRLSLKLSCEMFLYTYPFDWQACGVVMESYGHSTATIQFDWFPDLNIDINRNMSLPQFYLIGAERYDCTKTYGEPETYYTCLNVTFNLKRKAGYFLIQLYVPSIMIVILSWVSFWLNVDAVPARISLGILTILAMTTQTSGAANASSRVSYVRAIDVWMFTCLVFVFSSLIEFALVNVFARRLHKQAASRASTPDIDEDIHLIENPQHRKRRPTSSYAMGEAAPGLINIPDPPPGFSSDTYNFRETSLNLLPKPDLENGLLLNNGRQRNNKRRSTSRTRSSKLQKIAVKKASVFDRVSRFLFPVLFLTFNLIYWATYMISYQFNDKRNDPWKSLDTDDGYHKWSAATTNV